MKLFFKKCIIVLPPTENLKRNLKIAVHSHILSPTTLKVFCKEEVRKMQLDELRYLIKKLEMYQQLISQAVHPSQVHVYNEYRRIIIIIMLIINMNTSILVKYQSYSISVQ